MTRSHLLPCLLIACLAVSSAAFEVSCFASGARPASNSPPDQVVATALFRVASHTPTILGEANAIDIQHYDIFKKTQLAQLRSYPVLSAALRDPKIASLSTIEALDDAMGWLQDNLIVEFLQNSEILAIRRGTEGQREELKAIVDAIAKAYTDEVIYSDRQIRLVTRDLLARAIGDLNEEIAAERQDYGDIAREADVAESATGRMRQQIDLKRLDRVEDEIIRLESESMQYVGEDLKKTALLEKRIADLRARRDEIEKRLLARSRESVELTTRQRKLTLLERLAEDMNMRLQRMDLEQIMPPRITQLQQAVITRAE